MHARKVGFPCLTISLRFSWLFFLMGDLPMLISVVVWLVGEQNTPPQMTNNNKHRNNRPLPANERATAPRSE